jgi:hypothetical protein
VSSDRHTRFKGLLLVPGRPERGPGIRTFSVPVSLNRTFEAANEACRTMSDWAWTQQTFTHHALHQASYAEDPTEGLASRSTSLRRSCYCQATRFQLR